MTNQSKRDILEEILTRLAILQAKVDYLVSAKENTPTLVQRYKQGMGKSVIIPYPFIKTEPSEDCVKVDVEFPSVSIKLHETLEDKLGGAIHISEDRITNLQSKDVYFNGEEWVERPEDLSYIQKFYKPDDAIQCLFDNLSPQDRMKPMGLSCPCRKCSAYC